MRPAIKYASMLVITPLLMQLSGCSRKTLSIFFDGVPQEEATAIHPADSMSYAYEVAPVQNTGDPARVRTYYHAPYLERECNSCHDEHAMGTLTAEQPGLCYQCHEDFASKFAVLHVPVEMGMCTECHHPHQSMSKYLLKNEGQSLCLSCHDASEVLSRDQHDGIGETSCTDCHNPHGGSDDNLLN